MGNNEDHPIRRLRETLNMSIDDLAASSGVSARTIIRAEAGQGYVTVALLDDLS